MEKPSDFAIIRSYVNKDYFTDPDIVAGTDKIWEVYLVNLSENVYIASMQPSAAIWYLGHGFTSLEFDDDERLERLHSSLDEAFSYNEIVDYMDKGSLERMIKDPSTKARWDAPLALNSEVARRINLADYLDEDFFEENPISDRENFDRKLAEAFTELYHTGSLSAW